jgi:hypothetical protein
MCLNDIMLWGTSRFAAPSRPNFKLKRPASNLINQYPAMRSLAGYLQFRFGAGRFGGGQCRRCSPCQVGLLPVIVRKRLR